jgi:hypoxanthine phosphoribosyltransferase
MGQAVTLHDKQFKPYLSEQQIADTVKHMAKQIEADYQNESPYFLVVLSGAFMFAADLLKAFSKPCEVAFIKASSYDGMQSTGEVKLLGGLNSEVKNKQVIVVEDIVETGNTIECLMAELKAAGAAGVKVASLLFKKEIFKKTFPIHYTGLSIGNEFVVGYGLDYNGLGRNLKEIYVLA